MTTVVVSPALMPQRMTESEVARRALNAVAGKSAAEILSMLGNLDAVAGNARLKRTDETFRLFRLTASVWRTELSRKAPGTYVTLTTLH